MVQVCLESICVYFLYNIGGISFGDLGAAAISNVLEEHKTVKELWLSNSFIHDHRKSRNRGCWCKGYLRHASKEKRANDIIFM